MSAGAATLDKASRRVGVAAAAPGGMAPEILERIAGADQSTCSTGLALVLVRKRGPAAAADRA